MGTAVTPSCRKHHGYRTRDQPPARQARRYGFGDIARCRGNAFRRLAPIKKPAATNAAGFDHGRFHAFREGCGADAHLFQVAGGGAFGAAGYRVGFDHSLLQETSAGRNLITVFSTVNNLSQIIFAARAPLVRRTCVRCIGNECRKRARTHAQQRTRFLHASIGAACSDFPTRPCASTRRSRECVAPTRGDRATTSMRVMRARTTRCVCASHKPDCAKVRELFSRIADSRGTTRAFPRAGKRRTRDAAAAGSDDAMQLSKTWLSGPRLPAVRRSRPAPAVR